MKKRISQPSRFSVIRAGFQKARWYAAIRQPTMTRMLNTSIGARTSTSYQVPARCSSEISVLKPFRRKFRVRIWRTRNPHQIIVCSRPLYQ